MHRPWIWLQLVIGWMPVWALFAGVMMSAHGMPWSSAALASLRLVAIAAGLGLLVHRGLALRPWPYPFRWTFVAEQALAAAAFSAAWLLLNSLVESLLRGRLAIVVGPGLGPFFVTGVWMYVMVAAVGYAQRAAERGAQLQALETRSQLDALRAQLNPHFLFNSLHTVVQLIPLEPRAAARATQQLAELLRASLDEQRDLLPLAEEWALVSKYLEIESLRHGERLSLQHDIDARALHCELPSFALQTLVENALRHAVAPSIDATEVHIAARRLGDELLVSVADSGPGADPQAVLHSTGSGLRRLRERLSVLYGGRARLTVERRAPAGLRVSLRVPCGGDDD